LFDAFGRGNLSYVPFKNALGEETRHEPRFAKKHRAEAASGFSDSGPYAC
jgi:hypothetical protein